MSVSLPRRRVILSLDNRRLSLRKNRHKNRNNETLLPEKAKIFRLFMDAADEIFCYLDSRLNFQEINKSGLKKWKLQKNDILDKSLFELCPRIKKNGWDKKFFNVIKTGKTLSYDKIECPLFGDGYVNIKALRLGHGLGVIITDISKSYTIEKSLINSRSLLRNLSLHLQSLREEESRRIAREIHDEMAPNLTAFKLDLTWIDNRINGYPNLGPTIKKKIKSMTELIDLTLDSVQRTCSELRPVLLDDLGLIPAIEWQLDEFEKRTKIKCNLSTDCDDISLDSDLSVCLFRIFQEALTNIARHAMATKIRVSLKVVPQRNLLRLTIKDNGLGITKEEISSAKSFGLIGMRERLHVFNGRLKISGTPNRGTSVKADLPLSRE